MMKRSRSLVTAVLAALTVTAAVAVGLVARAESVPVSQLRQQTHIHGLAVDRQDP